MHIGGCPGDGELSAFASGDLPPEAVEVIAAHVTGCADCQARLAGMDARADDDAVVAGIRQGTRGGPPGVAAAPAGNGGGPDPHATADVAARLAADLAMGAAPAPPAGPTAEGPGGVIGPYRLRDLLGEGGFGSVYLAEQVRPVRRQVAIKLVKLGMDTRQVLARFAAERQALAMMDHPNIARVLDAGTTDLGRPYFVMELARGLPITEYCDDNRLTPRRRLELLAQVCDAVQHAHTKGVIHRDIKPTNVLVTMQDGRPVPKVIDFGIAKAIGGRLTDQTLYTELRHFLGTPQYMSPEQADGAALDVDARTDVYSLGVLMYELLTGATPLDGKELRSKGLDQIGRTIRDAEPPRPSTRVRGSPADTIEAVAGRRGTDARRLTQSLRGELDWIVMKCLEKDRTLRYETANALAMDVRRYLANEPVRAGPPGAAYQLRKFARRHRAVVTAAAAMAAAVLLGLGLAVYGWVAAGRERDRAKAARDGEAVERARAERAVADRDAAAQTTRLAQADAVATASPAAATAILDSLRAARAGPAGDGAAGPVEAVFRQRRASSPPGSVERLRAACALAILGDPQTAELVAAVRAAPASEGALVIGALAASGPVDVVPRLNALAAGEKDLRSRARYAITLLFLGDDREAVRALAPGTADPTPYSAFVAEFGEWHGDVGRLPDLLRRAPAAARGGLCLAAGRVDPQAASAGDRRAVAAVVADLYAADPEGGVHSACEFALRRWRVDLPAVAAGLRPAAGRGWFVNRSGLTMVRAPAGFNVIGREWEGSPTVPVLFTRPLFASAREVPYDLFREFADDPAVPAADRPAGWQNGRTRPRAGLPAVATNMSLAEAARFCNWLSRREGRRPCYTVDGEDPKQWRVDPAADGYRVPTSPEWEYAARAGAGTTNFCCDDYTYLEDYAVVTLAGDARSAVRQPNRWGLFDTAGGVWELTWDVDLEAQPAPPGKYDRPLGPHPVVDPWPADGGRYMAFRGGADDSGTFDLRLSFARPAPIDHRGGTKGFRVVCPGSAADAPPDVRPPADGAELWGWAAGKRPDIAYKMGLDLARRQRFAEAAAALAESFAPPGGPDEANQWFCLAVLRLHEGDHAGYRDACRALLAMSAVDGTGSRVWDRAAKAVLLDPAVSPDDLRAAADYAARAVRAGGQHLAYYQFADGLAEYRAGRLDAAARRFAEARGTSLSPGANALDSLFLAMALHRNGKPIEARANYVVATGLIGQFAGPDIKDWGLAWVDWAQCDIARREADRVLDAPVPPSRSTAPAER